MQTIKITIADKRAQVEGSPVLVCNNTGDKITFSFDDEWTGLSPKVARFAYTRDGRVLYQDVAFTADTVEIPPLSDISCVRVGVYAGELSTTTAAALPCLPSILSGPGGMDGAMIFPSDYGRFKLWNDITLEDDVLNISITKTDSGAPIKVKKLVLVFVGQIADDGCLMLRNNEAKFYPVYSPINKTSKNSIFWAETEKISDGIYISKYTSSLIGVDKIGDIDNININGALTKSSIVSNLAMIENPSRESEKTMTSIHFGGIPATPNCKLVAGSRILIWGVQDDD